MSGPVIEAVNLSVSRDNTPVLHDVSFQIQKGECFAFLGGNGAGKSTTLLTFLGLIKPSGGSARVFGKSVTDDPVAAREALAYLPESATLYGHLSAYENLNYFLSLAGLKRDRAEIDAALDRVALRADARPQKMDSYSKGMRQKTAIALALLRETPVLLLDEPTSGLDPIAIDEFNQLIRDLRADDKTILMVTHDVYGACHTADRIGLLRRGKLVGEFTAGANNRIDTEEVHKAFAAGIEHATGAP